MSLVAAYSDSESDSEECANESHAIVPCESKKIQNVESDDVPQITEQETHFQIECDENTEQKESADTGSHLFSELPQPKAKIYELVEDNDDEFMKKCNKQEDIPAPCNETQNTIKRTLNLPKPTKKMGKKQPVKIMISTLAEIGDDSDSEGEDSEKSNVTIQSKKSTLFSLLPKPRHSVMVGANKNKVFSRDANRPLVPHTLTKKKEATVSESKKEKTKEGKSLVTVELSDSDDDVSSENYFSLDSERDGTIKPSNLENNDESTCVISKGVPLLEHEKNKVSNIDTNSSDKGNTFYANLYKSDTNIKTESPILKGNIHKNTINTTTAKIENSKVVTSPNTSAHDTEKATAPYKNATVPYESVTAPYGDVTAPYESVTAPYGDVTAPYESVTAPYGDVTAPYGDVTAPYGNPSGSMIEVSTGGSSGRHEKAYPSSPHFFTYAYQQEEASKQIAEEVDYYHKPNEDLPIGEEALKALQGSKRNKEDINLIDIHASDIQPNNTDYLKSLTSESPAYQQLKSKKDKDQPTSGQKRKHQITYLAFQAKERELQLQQAWSESYASKRKTQSKYGF